MMQFSAKELSALMLIALAILLTGCATSLPTYAGDCPTWPMMPSVSEPTPSPSYSENARLNIDRWLKKLTELEATGRP